MFIFIHLILGLLIGLGFESKGAIIIIALLSHFILDYIPHWDGWFDKEYFERTGSARITYKDLYVVAVDFSLTIFSIFIFWHYAHLANIGYIKMNVALGAFMSIFPDLLKLGYLTKLKNKEMYSRYLKFHSKIQKKSDEVDWKVGLFIQMLFLMILLVSIAYIMFF